MRSHLARTTTTARTTQATTRMTTLAALAIASMIALTGCSSSSTPQSSNTTTPSIEITDTTVILDVRTEQEWNEGHLDGAELLDFTGGDFTQALPDLDPDADYVLYCRSGNRAGQAAALMDDAGFDSVINAGSVTEAATATGLDIVVP